MINYVRRIIFGIIIIFCVLGIVLYCSKKCSMENLHEGNLKNTYYSRDGKYTLNSYLYSPGALVNFSLRVEVVNNDTKKKRNIYWNFDEDSDNIEWIEESVVIINGQKIDLENGWYNCECIINNGVSE